MIESRSEKKEDGLRGFEKKSAALSSVLTSRTEISPSSTWSSTIHEEVPAREQCEAPAVQGERSRSKARLEFSTVATATPSTVQPTANTLVQAASRRSDSFRREVAVKGWQTGPFCRCMYFLLGRHSCRGR